MDESAAVNPPQEQAHLTASSSASTNSSPTSSIYTLFEKDGVFIHTTIATEGEDVLVSGKIFIYQKAEKILVEWKPSNFIRDWDKPVDAEWDMVESVGSKNKPTDQECISNKPTMEKNGSTKYSISFELKDLKSFRRSYPTLGWSYVTFTLKSGVTYPTLHFHKGGTKAFIKFIEQYISIKKSSQDSCVYLVKEHDPQALSRSFNELNLFEEQHHTMVSEFIKDPYNQTLDKLSKIPSFFNTVFGGETHHETPKTNEHFTDQLQNLAINNRDEPGFEIITPRPELPPKKEVVRDNPLTSQQWLHHMSKDGAIRDVDNLKKIIFRGGVEPKIRIEVWKFLLHYYDWNSTHKQRSDLRKQKVDDYFRMKLQWKSVQPDQERRFSVLTQRKSLIDKDVTRTDRVQQFFKGDDNPNIQVLYDVLMTYCMYHFDLGYVQGMSDLLSPILYVMENEVDAFWCFTGFMDRVYKNFEMDQAGMKKQLEQLSNLIRFYDPELSNYFESQDSSNMYFCFRWFLILFKREFQFNDIMRLWEVLWSDYIPKGFHLAIALAIIENQKSTITENGYGFTEILKHINDLTGHIDLETTLVHAEAIYNQLKTCSHLPEFITDIFDWQPELKPNSLFEEVIDDSSGSAKRISRPSALPGRPVPASQTVTYHANNQTLSNKNDGSIEMISSPHEDVP